MNVNDQIDFSQFADLQKTDKLSYEDVVKLSNSLIEKVISRGQIFLNWEYQEVDVNDIDTWSVVGGGYLQHWNFVTQNTEGFCKFQLALHLKATYANASPLFIPLFEEEYKVLWNFSAHPELSKHHNDRINARFDHEHKLYDKLTNSLVWDLSGSGSLQDIPGKPGIIYILTSWLNRASDSLVWDVNAYLDCEDMKEISKAKALVDTQSSRSNIKFAWQIEFDKKAREFQIATIEEFKTIGYTFTVNENRLFLIRYHEN